MRIGFFVPSFPRLSETFVLEQAAQLLEAGHDVRIVCLLGGDWEVGHPALRRANLRQRTTYLMSEGTNRGDILLRAGGRFLRHLPDSGVVLWKLLGDDLDRRMKPSTGASAMGILSGDPSPPWCFDVIQVHFGPMGLVTDALRELGLVQGPMVVTFHGSDVTVARQIDPERYDGLFRRADMMTANSRFLRQELIGLGAPPHNIVHLPMGVDPSTISACHPYTDGMLRVLTVARLSEEKGVRFGLDAMALLRRAQVEFRYTVIGDGPLRPRLERQVRALGLQDCVRLVGAMPHDDVLRALQEHDLFLFPAVKATNGAVEAQGRALVEAQAAALPIVATDVGGVQETVAEGAGVIVPSGDAGALAHAVEALVQDTSGWEEMGRRGRRHVEQHFDQRSTIRRLERIYRSLHAPEREP